MAVTIKDVAALAGVSPSTVSRTCKNNPPPRAAPPRPAPPPSGGLTRAWGGRTGGVYPAAPAAGSAGTRRPTGAPGATTAST